jgi:signal transduction histidine kinase
MLKIFSFNKLPDPDLNRKASILVKIIWSVLIIMTSALLLITIFIPENFARYFLVLVLLWSTSLVLLLLGKKGYRYTSAVLYVSFLLLMIFGFSLSGGGIKGHAIKLLPSVVLFAGLTLGKREIWVFGIIAVLGALALVAADHFHLIYVREPLGQSGWIYWISTTTAILLLCFLENFSVEELRKSLDETQKELALRKASEELLKAKNEKLAEIAFLQSHIVRKPVANVLGLINLIKMDDQVDLSKSNYIPTLEAAAKELDIAIHEIILNTNDIEAIVKNEENIT